ncbi:uracil phosphoribosyltransferase [Halosquirtibacter xylanolyticus]|uniref:uracil phosphoribosyltransferase n=1 Tax=Halosquirtibacter xylanolyticus TaxID=3374599 RepID=UPI003748AD78|nr:uracil phosphoribosyltransferase [Prolixibacteraceae bacterium]
MVHIIGENNSLFNNYIAEIRDVEIQKDPLRFRRNLERVGEIMAYEISKHLDYSEVDVQTPLGNTPVSIIDKNVVLATILRAGLPLHQGLLNAFDRAENCFISAYRKHNEGEDICIEFEYIASPSLDDKIVILSDPILATGSSMEVGYKALLEKGTPKHVHIVSVVGSKEGVEYIKKHLGEENVTLWVGAVDPELNSQSYIVPGLGDAGDLAFGPKIDSK